MSEFLDRDDVIRLLNQLGDDDDAVALSSARDLHAQITAAGVTWNELLMPDTPETAAETPTESSTENTAEAPVAASSLGGGDTLALIEELLARPDRSEALRDELEEYKTDIANGEFEERDHKYVRALYARLSN